MEPNNQPRLTAEEWLSKEHNLQFGHNHTINDWEDFIIKAMQSFARQEVDAVNAEWREKIEARINEIQKFHDHADYIDSMDEYMDTAYYKGQITELQNLLK